MSITGAAGRSITVSDGEGKVYFESTIKPELIFIVSGALGKHTVRITGKKGTVSTIPFSVDALTSIDDGGRYSEMFNLFYTSMQTDTGSVVWNGKRYRYLFRGVLTIVIP